MYINLFLSYSSNLHLVCFNIFFENDVLLKLENSHAISVNQKVNGIMILYSKLAV